MKPGQVVKKTSNKQHRFLESTTDFSKVKKQYLLFENTAKDMDEIEWWESQLDLLGMHRALIQVEKTYADGRVVPIGYNILTDRQVDVSSYGA